MKFDSEFPVLWFSGNGDESGMLYKGPKDIDSLMFFINDRMGIGGHRKKVISIIKRFRSITEMISIFHES